jgi:hypothetical protein
VTVESEKFIGKHAKASDHLIGGGIRRDRQWAAKLGSANLDMN